MQNNTFNQFNELEKKELEEIKGGGIVTTVLAGIVIAGIVNGCTDQSKK